MLPRQTKRTDVRGESGLFVSIVRVPDWLGAHLSRAGVWFTRRPSCLSMAPLARNLPSQPWRGRSLCCSGGPEQHRRRRRLVFIFPIVRRRKRKRDLAQELSALVGLEDPLPAFVFVNGNRAFAIISDLPPGRGHRFVWDAHLKPVSFPLLLLRLEFRNG